MTSLVRMKRRTLVMAGTLAMTLPHARAQAYPSRPIHLVLGFTPAGSGDFVGRVIAEEASHLLGVQILVENRPGAATNIASEFVARAEPDGYTLLLGGSFSHSVNPALFEKLGYEPQKDFVPITRAAVLPTVFAVPSALPVKTLQEFIELARREGSRWNYASAGVGSPGHIAGAYFVQATGLALQHIPYKGSSEAVRALVAGEVQLTITSPPSVLGLAREGRVRLLALTTPGRSQLLPDVPGSDEAGLKDFNLDGWYGVFAPARTPAATVRRLFDAFTTVLRMPAVVTRLESQAATPSPSTSPEEFAAFVRSNAQTWQLIVKRSGARAL